MQQENINSTLQQEIAEIEKKLIEKKALLENGQQTSIQEKETLKEVVKEHFSGSTSSTSTQSDDDTQNDDATPIIPITDDDPSYLSPKLKEQVQELINETFSKSITEAVATARKTKNPALIDAFHDALVDQLYDHLLERGKITTL